MKPRYDALTKLRLLSGGVYDVAQFVVWFLTLPFIMGYDLIYITLKAIANSPSFQLFIKSSFASLLLCSCLFTLAVFAPFPFPIWGIVAIKVLLLFALIFPAMNGLRVLDQKYAMKETTEEDKMLTNIRKQINIGVPDKPSVSTGEDPSQSIEMLTLQVRLAEMEARSSNIEAELRVRQQELELKEKDLELKAKELESPLYQLKRELEARKVLVSDLEITAKEENLGLKERPRDQDLTNEEKKAIGMSLDTKASTKQLKIVRGLEDALIQAKYQPKLFKFDGQRNHAIVEFTVQAVNPTLPDNEDFIEAMMRIVDSNSIKVMPLNKAIRFIVSSTPYREKGQTYGIIEGNNDPTVLS